MTLVKSPAEIVEDAEATGSPGLLARHPTWPRVALGEFSRVQNGAAFSSKQFNNDGVGTPLIRIRNVGTDQTDTYFSGSVDEAYIVSSGDLLIGMDGDFRVARWRGPDALLNQRVCRLHVDEATCLSQFVELALQGYLDAIWQETSSVTVKHLSSRTVAAIPLPVPPLPEQQRIVEILEEQLSRLDAALDSVRVVREKAAQFRRSLLHAAFTGALTVPDEPGAGPPASWSREPLGSVLLDIQTGFSSGSHNSSGDGVPHLRPMNINRMGSLDLGEIKFVEDASDRRLRRGDVLFNNTNSPTLVGKTALVDSDESLAFSNHMTRLRVDPSALVPAFLAHQLHAMWMNGIFEAICSNHVNQASVSRKRLQDVAVILPPLAEQQRIVEIIEEQLSRLDASMAVADQIEKRSAALRRSLLHAAFTGRLTEQWREHAHV